MRDGRGTVQGNEASEAAGLDVATKFETISLWCLWEISFSFILKCW